MSGRIAEEGRSGDSTRQRSNRSQVFISLSLFSSPYPLLISHLGPPPPSPSPCTPLLQKHIACGFSFAPHSIFPSHLTSLPLPRLSRDPAGSSILPQPQHLPTTIHPQTLKLPALQLHTLNPRFRPAALAPRPPTTAVRRAGSEVSPAGVASRRPHYIRSQPTTRTVFHGFGISFGARHAEEMPRVLI